MRESPCPSRGRCICSCSARSRVKCHPGRTRPNSERSHPAPVPWCPRGGSWASFLLSSRNSKTRTISKVGMGVAPSARDSSTGTASASHRVTAETARPPALPPTPRLPQASECQAGGWGTACSFACFHHRPVLSSGRTQPERNGPVGWTWRRSGTGPPPWPPPPART